MNYEFPKENHSYLNPISFTNNIFFQHPKSPLRYFNGFNDTSAFKGMFSHDRINEAVSMIPKPRIMFSRRRRNGISANSWDIIKQSIKGA